jgi:hypothetical protein
LSHILATLAEEDDASATEWFWLRMTDGVREEKFAEHRYESLIQVRCS